MSKFLLSHAGPQKSYLKPNKSIYLGIKEKNIWLLWKIKFSSHKTRRTKGIFEIFWTPSYPYPGIDQCVITLLCICLTEERKILTIGTLSAEEKSLTTYLTLQKVIAVQNLEPLVTSSCHISEWILLLPSCPAFAWLFISNRRMNEENFVVFSFKIFPFHGEQKK